MTARAARTEAAVKAPRTASKQRLRLWLRLLRAARAIESALRERLRVSFQLTLPQFDVMAALARSDSGMTMTELSRLLMVSNGNVTGIVGRLVSDGLIERQTTAADRRAIHVSLTRRGQVAFRQVAAAHEGWVDELLSHFTRADTDLLIGHLDGLARRIRKGAGRA